MPEPPALHPNTTYVFVALSTCGHAQCVYIDSPHPITRRETEPLVLANLRAGLTVKRITLQEYNEKYADMLLCDCKTVGHEMDQPKGGFSA